ncbi:hypothetical protein BJ742DRAFT_873424 [Cladochytrium replicatum]|nr:hypothetical protein BJ742DRAFT_873424 [Cladochytrium replicatum]
MTQLSALLILTLASLVLGQVTTDLFSLHRKDFDAFVRYAPETRQYVADSIEKRFGLYPSLDSKLANHLSRADYRPPPLRDLVVNSKNYTDREFHLKMFSSLRDFHASYAMPYPYGCATVFIPIHVDLSKTDDQFNDPRPAVVSRESEDILNLTPGVKQIQFGDILEKKDGLSFKEFFELVQDDQGGSILSGGYRNTGQYADNTTLTFARCDLTGSLVTRYTVTLQWLIVIDTQSCEPATTWPNNPPIQVPQNAYGRYIMDRPIDEKTRKILLTPVMIRGHFETLLSGGDQIPYNPSYSLFGWTTGVRWDSCLLLTSYLSYVVHAFTFDLTDKIFSFFNFTGDGSIPGNQRAPVAGGSLIGLKLRFKSDATSSAGIRCEDQQLHH